MLTIRDSKIKKIMYSVKMTGVIEKGIIISQRDENI